MCSFAWDQKQGTVSITLIQIYVYFLTFIIPCNQDLTGIYYTIKSSAEPVEEAPATNAEARRAVVCEDDYETCGQYEEYCETNYYVKNHCLKTCGTCSKLITTHYKLLSYIELNVWVQYFISKYIFCLFRRGKHWEHWSIWEHWKSEARVQRGSHGIRRERRKSSGRIGRTVRLIFGQT